jgi:hypothetical protein
MYKPHKHKHVYVYDFVLSKHKSHSVGYAKCEYTLCTDITGPNTKQNRKLLEIGLRIAYKHYPKTVKFAYEKYD